MSICYSFPFSILMQLAISFKADCHLPRLGAPVCGGSCLLAHAMSLMSSSESQTVSLWLLQDNSTRSLTQMAVEVVIFGLNVLNEVNDFLCCLFLQGKVCSVVDYAYPGDLQT